MDVQMKKVLFFPLLKMPSGHHQVADAIATYLTNRNSQINCKKIDLLSAWNPFFESVITATYIEWITHFPKSYAWAYQKMAHTSKTVRSYKYYEMLFERKMKQIVEEEKPDLIICTHAFPSYLLNRLKMKRKCSTPIINVYTDYFINDVWGKTEIDYHFVPSMKVKKELIERYDIKEKHIIVTGIPIAEEFERSDKLKPNDEKKRVLIAGGSIGMVNIISLLQHDPLDSNIEYVVLCGKNQKLFQAVTNMGSASIHALPYISSRKRMNDLYNRVDAIITKPGGVTISESLNKEIPIFVHSSLPGQEEINLTQLEEAGLVHQLNNNQTISNQIIEVLMNTDKMEQFQRSCRAYKQSIDNGKPHLIYNFIHDVLNVRSNVRITSS